MGHICGRQHKTKVTQNIQMERKMCKQINCDQTGPAGLFNFDRAFFADKFIDS